MPMFRLFDHLVIRDTNTHLPQYPLIPMQGRSGVCFTVQNSTDQEATVQLIGNGNPSVVGITVFANALPVGANSREQMAVTESILWNAFMGVQIFFATSPTLGEVTVKALTRED